MSVRCKNCGTLFNENFCPHCGQNSNVGKINLPNFLNEVSESVFQINRGLFFTTKELSLRPGYSIREFLNGKRKKYFKPLAYALLFSTLYFLVSRMVGENTWMNDFIAGVSNAAEDTKSDLQTPVILVWFSENFAYATLLLLPIFSLASYLAFLGHGTNYLEHIVLNSYVTGHQAIIYAIFLVLKSLINSEVFEWLAVLITVAYCFWAFWQFFSAGSRFINVLRSALMYGLYITISFGLLFVLLTSQMLLHKG